MQEIKIDKEFSALIPPLTPEELHGLETSLMLEGCRDALVVWKETGILLDGHNRLRICEARGILFETREISLPDRDAAKLWIIQNQLARRNLTPGARIELVMGLEAIIAKQAKGNQIKRKGGQAGATCQNSDNLDPIDTKKEMAKLAGTSHDTYAKGKIVFERGDEETKAALRKGDVTVNRAYQNIAKKQKAIQKAAAPSGEYRVIYADPPWEYSRSGMPDYGDAAFHYPTMPLPDICALPIASIAEDDAVLFLWATSPLVEEAFEVIRAWGFTYKASFVWDKVKHNFGHYNSVRHEFLLVATRGSCTPDEKKLFDSVVTVERSEKHSEKPEDFRKIIDALYTHGKRIELFARATVKGWERWGNE